MQRFWSWLAVNLGRHAGMVTAIGLVFTVVLALGITRIEFATGQDSYIQEGSQLYDDNIEYQELFGGNALLTAITMDEGHSIDEMFDPETVAELERVADEMRDSSHVMNVISPVSAMQFSADLVKAPEGGTVFDAVGTKALSEAAEQAKARGDTESAKARDDDLLVSSGRLLAIPPDRHVVTDQAYAQFLLYTNEFCKTTRPATGDEVASCPNPQPGGPLLVGTGPKIIRKALLPFFPDSEHAVLVARFDGNQDIKTDGESAMAGKEIAGTLEVPNASTTTAGASLLLKDINDYLMGGMLTLGGIAVAVMIAILMLFFHVRWRLLPLGVVLVGIVWAFGLAGFIGIPLTLVTIAGLPVMLGIGIDYAIQMHSRIEEEVRIDRAPHPIQEAARGLGPALLVVTFDAVFAFLAIQLSHVPMIREVRLAADCGDRRDLHQFDHQPLGHPRHPRVQEPDPHGQLQHREDGQVGGVAGQCPSGDGDRADRGGRGRVRDRQRSGAEARVGDRPDQVAQPSTPTPSTTSTRWRTRSEAPPSSGSS
ncbi:MAG: MMPL family transporter [Microthrixaceae bacterium]|nr:MMPL family transporter [Microthrixaceae bacterium]